MIYALQPSGIPGWSGQNAPILVDLVGSIKDLDHAARVMTVVNVQGELFGNM